MTESGREEQVTESQVEAAEAASEDSAQAVESDFEAMLTQINSLSQERDNIRDQFLRTTADFQNFRKRTQQEASLLRQFATENLVTNLLPALDNFERTLAYMESGADPTKVFDGIRAVERQLRGIIESQNVRRIPAVGQPFDPELHEAIGVETTDAHPENTVVIEVEAGYKMGEKVIRPAKVKVSQTP